ncbi:hypothetical protein LPJ81_003798 [Coemansia sp. IMI 209127]|nr:hypothetical protein LPJ81_003798 [Coemansia sp. IMI 209127]
MNLRKTRIGLALVLAIGVVASAGSDSANDSIPESITLDNVDESSSRGIGSTSDSDGSSLSTAGLVEDILNVNNVADSSTDDSKVTHLEEEKSSKITKSSDELDETSHSTEAASSKKEEASDTAPDASLIESSKGNISSTYTVPSAETSSFNDDGSGSLYREPSSSSNSPSENLDDSNNADSEPGTLTGFTTVLEAQISSLSPSTTGGDGGGLLGNLVGDLLGPDSTTDAITQSEDPATNDPEESGDSEPGSLAGFTTVLEAQSSSLSPSTTGGDGGGLLGSLVGDLLGPGSTTDAVTQNEELTTDDQDESVDSDPNSLAGDTTVLEDQSDTTTDGGDGGLLGNFLSNLLDPGTTTDDTGDSGADDSTVVADEDTTTSDGELIPEISWPEISWPEISWPEISWPAISWPVVDTQTDTESADGLSIIEVPTESQDGSLEVDTTETPFLPPWFETTDEESDIVSTTAPANTVVSDILTSDDFSWDQISSNEEFTTGDTFSVETSTTNVLEETSEDVVESTDLVTSSWVSPVESEVEAPTTSSSEETETSTPVVTSTPTTTSTTSSSSTTTTKGVISVPTSVDFSRLTADSTETASAGDSADSNDSLPQVVTNPLSPTCSQCLTFTLRILAPYANLFGSNNYLASQAFNQIPNLVATALGINNNRATASMIFAEADAVVAANRRRSLLVRDTEPDYPHYYISLSITKDSSALNPKSELQGLSTSLSSQVRDSSSELHTLNSWGSLIDRTYMVVTSNLDDLNGVAQVAPDSPGQVDSPLQSDAKSTSRSKWIGVGVGVSCAVVLGICILMVHYRRRHHMLSKRQIRQNFVAIQ